MACNLLIIAMSTCIVCRMLQREYAMNEQAMPKQQANDIAARRRPARLDSATMKEIDALLIKPIQPAASAPHDQPSAAEVRHPLPSVEQPRSDPSVMSALASDMPMGIAVGTTHCIIAQNNGRSVKTVRQHNAFFTMPASAMVRKSLQKEGVSFFEKNNKLYIFGSAAEQFATLHGARIRKPIERGILNPREESCMDVVKAVIETILPRATRENVPVCFSVPGEPIGRDCSTVFHTSVLKMHLQSLGYRPFPVNEGLAVVLAELADTNFTGIGISIGGGLCNVCFAYLAVPVLTFSIPKGGDYIDALAAEAVGEPPHTIRAVKENGFDLSSRPDGKIETALHIFYDDLFACLCQGLEQMLCSSDKIPRMPKGLPIVLGGGSVAPKGCRERFAKALAAATLPVQITDIRVAEHPLSAAARGSLRMALEEGSV